MKRLTALLLVLLMLAGCTVQKPEPTTEPTTVPTEPTTEPTQPLGAAIYEENSTLEQQTGGAVMTYTAGADCDAVYPMGEDILLFYADEQTQIMVYTGETLQLKNTVRLDVRVVPGDRGVQLSDRGLSYYDPNTRQVVLLDTALTETDRVDLPENAQGIPTVDPGQTTAYFCTENEIRALDLETGIAALRRQETVAWQSILDVCFDGSVLLCDVIDEEQNGYVAYIDTENGKLLGKDTFGWGFSDYDNAFLMTNAGEPGEGALYGTWDSEVVNLVPAGDDANVWPALPLGGAVAVRTGADGIILDFYTLESGLRTSSVTLAEGTDAYGFAADEMNRCIWFLLEDTATGNRSLCRWNYEMTAVADETVYLLPRYTELVPDTEGLANCQAEADALAAANGMEIRIWKAAVTEPWEELRSDYRVSSFRRVLTVMEHVLSAFPEGMVAKLASISDSNVTSVSLVRGEGETANAQFKWVDGSTYIALETGDGSAEAFCNALYRAMDTYILNSNSILDEWDAREPVNDRAMIFQYAMTEGMEDYFESASAQSKLKQLCKAIRDAFELKKYEGELLWEQYLEE